jgi:hypothetical protein
MRLIKNIKRWLNRDKAAARYYEALAVGYKAEIDSLQAEKQIVRKTTKSNSHLESVITSVITGACIEHCQADKSIYTGCAHQVATHLSYYTRQYDALIQKSINKRKLRYE